MRIASLRVQHFRVHRDYTLEPSPTVTVITGKNGSGKTSLLEAVVVTLQGSSFKTGDTSLLQHGNAWYRIDIGFDDGRVRTVKFDSERVTGRKQFIVDDKTYYRLPRAQKYPVVVFEPEDLRLLHGSPDRRRRFIDQLVSQVDVQYSAVTRRYERALKQRNALLKQPGTHADDLFAWNVSLSEYGSYMIARRQGMIERLNGQLGETYRKIAETDDQVSLAYSHVVVGDMQQKLLAELTAAARKDMVTGHTSVGPHRHDCIFSFNGASALEVASRGEVRSVVLALKFLEVAIIEDMTGQEPIILLDDVFSELDEVRQRHLTKAISGHQRIITSAATVPELEGKIVTVSGQ